jgi:hypothetical protein
MAEDDKRDRTRDGKPRDDEAHTELRHRQKHEDGTKAEKTPLKPRTPVDRLPDDGDDDDMFNDMPV